MSVNTPYQDYVWEKERKELYDSVCKAYDNEIALLKEQLENKNRDITKNELDYCVHCGCPKDICCRQGKISLERLEQLVNENHFRSVKDLLLAAKKEVGKK